ncbi:MAG: ATP phosphoribosyltransferase [Alphaproteobacteria bacterium]|nr:MAG: ATP phosphoribosyltransferase [Alphaproteobacteria bacterium]
MSNLILAIPSKGRLMEATSAFFAKSGMKISHAEGARNYTGKITGVDNVEVRFMSAGEIAGGLLAGEVHMGVTGRDLLHEQAPIPGDFVKLLTALGFGHARVIVAVPDAWMDVENMRDLGEVCEDFRARHHRPLRVATKYFGLTRAFFAENGIIDYRIVESLGATEGAPAAGTAEAIVDITSTGATLVANRLKILSDGEILNSEAFLSASLTATWDETSMAAARTILDHVIARQRAENKQEMRADISDLLLEGRQFLIDDPRIEMPFGGPMQGDTDLVLHVARKDVHAVSADLRERGCRSISVRDLDYIYTGDNPLFAELLSALPRD